eukprot:3980655-Ditylum_brightwellii.AAC.1
MPAKEASPLVNDSVKLIEREKGMRKVEAQKSSRWEQAVSEKHGEFLKKLSSSRKEKGRRWSVCEVLWEFVSEDANT